MKKILAILFLLISFNIFSINLLDVNNNVVKYEDLVEKTDKGIINYEALWCPHCIEYLNTLNKFKDKKKNVDVIVIFTDVNMKQSGYTGFEDVKKYIKDNKLDKLKIYYDYKNEMISHFKFNSVPIQTIVFKGKPLKKFDTVYTFEDLMYEFRKY